MKWTVIFDDRKVLNQSVKNEDGWPVAYVVGDDAFWNDSKWENIHAIQFIDDNQDHNDCVEMYPGTLGRNQTWAEAGLGDFTSQFIDKWDAAHLSQLQSNWDSDNVDGESEADKISRLGARPSSYTSS